MKFLEDIKNETLIISRNSFKEQVLSLNKLIPIKFMTTEEFIEKYCFSYTEDAILYVINKYHIKYDIAKMYLDNLYYIEDKKYNNNKLDFLVDLKHNLEENNLLVINKDFRRYVKNIDIIIYDIRIDKYLERVLTGLNYKRIDRDYQKYNHTVYSFKTMEEECEYVVNKISTLIDSGVDINNIKLTNIDKDYYSTLERIFSLFNIKINIPYRSKLSSYKIVKDFIDLYKENSLEDSLSKIDKNDKLYGEIINVINNYLKYNNKDLIIYKLEHTYINSTKYSNAIEIVDYLDYISSPNDYIFMLGFNDSIVPKSYKDIDYITDNITSLVGINNTMEKNTWLREDIIKNLGDIKNLTITYKLKDNKMTYYPSTMCSYFNQEEGDTNYKVSYSEKYNEIKLLNRYDEYKKYGSVSADLPLLYNNFKLHYNSYDNKYHKINRVMDKLTLSYSKMQIYNKCAFRYYLSEILKLDIFEENFSTVIGSMVHYVMENCLRNNSMDTDKYVNEYLGDRKFTKKENFFLGKYKEAIKDLLDEIVLEREYGLFNQAMYEKKIEIDYGNNIKFVGIIDKVLYYIDDNKTYLALVDYKTGKDLISLKYLKYGLDIQLPIYLYLSTKLDFSNPVYVGFYLQRFNIKEKDYRLIGYSNSDKNTLEVIDKNYANSKIIRGMKTNKDGSFARYANVLSDSEIEDIKKETEEEIKKVIEKIKNNDFTINPKVIDNVNRGCEYCQFRDICNKTNDDMVIINTKDEEME